MTELGVEALWHSVAWCAQGLDSILSTEKEQRIEEGGREGRKEGRSKKENREGKWGKKARGEKEEEGREEVQYYSTSKWQGTKPTLAL